MILQELQTYLQTHSHPSLDELMHHFQSDADVLRAMLNLLIRKGRVRQLVSKACGSCHCCTPESLECYEWVVPSRCNSHEKTPTSCCPN